MPNRIKFPREVLLIEVERRCSDPSCNARARMGLTKEEARAYTGFECARCGAWNEDALAERDIPDWWEELKLTALDGVRPLRSRDSEANEDAEAVARLSEAWRRLRGDSSAQHDTEAEVDQTGGSKSS